MADRYRLQAVLEARADTSEIYTFQAAVAELEASMAALSDEEIDIRADGSQALAEAAAVRAGMQGIPDQEVGVDVNSGAALAELAAIRTAVEAANEQDIDIDVNVRRGGLLGILRRSLSGIFSLVTSGARGFTLLGEAGVLAGRTIVSAFEGGVGLLQGLGAAAMLAARGIGLMVTSAFTVVGVLAVFTALNAAIASLTGIIVAATVTLFGMVSIVGLFAGAAVAGFGLAAAAGFALYQIMQRDETAFQGLRDAAREFGQAFVESFQQAAGEFAGLSRVALEFGIRVLPQVGEAATGVVRSIREGFQSLVSNVFPQAKESVDRIFGGLPGVMRDVTTAIGAFGVGLTGVLAAAMPVVEDLAGWLSDIARDFASWANSAGGQQAIQDFFQDIKDAMPKIMEGVDAILRGIDDLGDVDIQKFAQQFESFGRSIETIADFMDTMSDAWARFKKAISPAVEAVQAFRRALGDAFGDGHPLVLDFFENFGQNLSGAIEGIGEFINNLRTKFVEGFDSVSRSALEFGENLRQRIGEGLQQALQSVQEFGSNLRTGITAAMALAVAAVATGVALVVTTVSSGFSSAVSEADSYMGQLVTGVDVKLSELPGLAAAAVGLFVSSLVSGFAEAVAAAGQAAADAVAALNPMEGGFSEAGANAVAALAAAITAGASSVISAAASVAQQAIAAAKGALGISSPSREFMEIGFETVRGLAQSLLDNTPLAVAEAQRMADQIREAMLALVDDVGALEISPRIGTPALAGASPGAFVSSPGGLAGGPTATSAPQGTSRGDSAAAAEIRALRQEIARGQRVTNAEEVAAYIAQVLPGVTESPAFNDRMNERLSKSVQNITKTITGG